MKILNQLFIAAGSLFFLSSCQENSMLHTPEPEMVYLNNELTDLSTIDMTDDQLTTLMINEDEPNGRMFTDKKLMNEWVSSLTEGNEILESLERKEKFIKYLDDNKLREDGSDPELRKMSIRKYIDKNFDAEDRFAVKLILYKNTGFDGANKTYWGGFSEDFLDGDFNKEVESFKAWGNSIPGGLYLFSDPNFNGSSVFYWRVFYRKRANLNSFNNLTESFIHL